MEVNFTFFALIAFSIAVSSLMFYVPGSVLLSFALPKLKAGAAVPFGVGIAVWALVSYFLSYLGLRQFTWLYLGVFFLIYIKIRPQLPDFKSFFKTHKLLILLIALGCFFQLLAIFPSGIKSNEGIWFYHINAYDGMYHLGLVKSLIRSFPPIEPGLSGELVVNYHYFSNLVMADASRMFAIPASLLVFQAFPILTSIFYGLLAYKVGESFTSSKKGGLIFTFLAYFGSDIGYLTQLILLGDLSITNLQAIDTASLLLTNPPRALSFIVFLTGFYLFLEFVKNRKLSQYLLSSLVLVATLGFKVYTGILGAAIASFGVVWGALKKRKLGYLISLLMLGLVGLFIYLPTNSKAGGIFWAPFAWPKHYFESTTLSSLNWHLKEDFFQSEGNYLRVFQIKFAYLFVFLITVMGARIIGLFAAISKRLSPLQKTVYLISILFLFLATFTLQTSGLFNTFNFLSVAALALSLLTALFVTGLKGRLATTLVILIVVLSLPRPVAEAYGHIQQLSSRQKDSYLISQAEIQAMDYINRNTSGKTIIIASPDNRLDYYSPYVEIFTERQTFFSNQDIVESHAHNLIERKKAYSKIFSSKTKEELFTNLKLKGINLLYIKLPALKAVDFNYSANEILFENGEVLVIKII